VTGMLLHANGDFIQAIEGPEECVAEMFFRIGRDPRHRAVVKLYDQPIARRAFADWTMAYRDVGRLLDGHSTYMDADGAADPATFAEDENARALLAAFRRSLRRG
jgi:hypothetical protein